MTPGADGETADGMTLGKIERIIDALRHERYTYTVSVARLEELRQHAGHLQQTCFSTTSGSRGHAPKPC